MKEQYTPLANDIVAKPRYQLFKGDERSGEHLVEAGEPFDAENDEQAIAIARQASSVFTGNNPDEGVYKVWHREQGTFHRKEVLCKTDALAMSDSARQELQQRDQAKTGTESEAAPVTKRPKAASKRASS